MRLSIQRSFAIVFAVVISAVAAGDLTAQVAAADAAPFVGDWNVEVQGDAPATFRINITNADGQVAVAVTGSEGGNFVGRNIRKDGANLLFDYTTVIMGQEIPAAVVLTPEGAGLKGTIDLAGMIELPLVAQKRS